MQKRNVVKKQNPGRRARWFAVGLTGGIAMLSIALGSVPTRGRVTDDTALYQSLSEIRARRQADLNFDGDIARLSAMEDRYREDKLPRLSDLRKVREAARIRRLKDARRARLQAPMKRIAARKYQYSGSATTTASSRTR